jgi:hypothetical protein
MRVFSGSITRRIQLADQRLQLDFPVWKNVVRVAVIFDVVDDIVTTVGGMNDYLGKTDPNLGDIGIVDWGVRNSQRQDALTRRITVAAIGSATAGRQ